MAIIDNETRPTPDRGMLAKLSRAPLDNASSLRHRYRVSCPFPCLRLAKDHALGQYVTRTAIVADPVSWRGAGEQRDDELRMSLSSRPVWSITAACTPSRLVVYEDTERCLRVGSLHGMPVRDIRSRPTSVCRLE